MVEDQNVTFVYNLPDNFPTGKLKIIFQAMPVVPMPGDVIYHIYFIYDVSEAD